MAGYVYRSSRVGDAVLFYAPGVCLAFNYYGQRMRGRSNYPIAVHPKTCDLRTVLTGARAWPGDRGPSARILKGLSADYDRVWLILSHARFRKLGRRAVADSMEKELDAAYWQSWEKNFAGARVLLYTAPRGRR